jgi:hypothetical protein
VVLAALLCSLCLLWSTHVVHWYSPGPVVLFKKIDNQSHVLPPKPQ